MKVVQFKPKSVENNFFYALELKKQVLTIYGFSAMLESRKNVKSISFLQLIKQAKQAKQSREELETLLVSGVPGSKKYFTYIGKTSFNISDFAKDGQWVDYSIFDVGVIDGFRFGPWNNVFSHLKPKKNQRLSQIMSLTTFGRHARLLVPVASNDFSQTTLVLTARYKPHFLGPGFSLKVNRSNDESPTQKPTWSKYFWEPRLSQKKLTVAANASVSVPVQLYWSQSSKKFTHKAQVFVSSDAGYLPYRSINFSDQGRAEIPFSAMGLKKGDVVNFQFSSQYFPDVGSLEIKVT